MNSMIFIPLWEQIVKVANTGERAPIAAFHTQNTSCALAANEAVA